MKNLKEEETETECTNDFFSNLLKKRVCELISQLFSNFFTVVSFLKVRYL